ncbi:hypothetical protein BaRGS_00039221 [Batillaria attramentaria]|uniref:Uncharacterized protein n=1 Tax=Batillaria attramentaria TaxID=370345 RepID=A0ABD0J3N7_9CAEN
MSAWHERLLLLSSEILATYDPSICSVEEQVTNFFKDHQVEDESDQQFITEVFSGCVRYAKPILVVLEGFYNRDGKNTLRSQQSVYHDADKRTCDICSLIGVKHCTGETSLTYTGGEKQQKTKPTMKGKEVTCTCLLRDPMVRYRVASETVKTDL